MSNPRCPACGFADHAPCRACVGAGVVPAPAEPEKAEWHILTVTNGGTVSLQQNLTETVARQVMQALHPGWPPWSDYAILGLIGRARQDLENPGRMYLVPPPDPGGFREVRCFGSGGIEFVVWPKPDDYEARRAALFEEYGVVERDGILELTS